MSAFRKKNSPIFLGFLILIIIFFGITYVLIKTNHADIDINSAQDKKTIISTIRDEKDVLETYKSGNEIKISEAARVFLDRANVEEEKICQKQIINILLKRNQCQLEDLDLKSLKQIDEIYLNGIAKITNIINEIKSK